MKKLTSYFPYILISLAAVLIAVVYALENKDVLTEKVLLIDLEDSYFVVVNEQENFTGAYPEEARILDEKGEIISLDSLNIGDYLLITSKDGVLLHESPPPYRHILKIRKSGEADPELAEEYWQTYTDRFKC